MEEKNKKGKGSTLIIILLLIIILGLVGYIYYTSTIAPKETKQEESISQSTEEGNQTIISDELKNDLLSLIPKDANNYFDYYIDAIYGKNKTLATDIDKGLLYEMAYNTTSSSTEKDELIGGVDYMWDCTSRESFDKALKNMYNIQADTVSKPLIDDVQSLEIYPMEDKVCRGLPGAGSTPTLLLTSIYNIEKNNEDLLLYVYVLFGDCVDGESICDGWNVYTDAKFENKIDSMLFSDKSLNESDMISKHYKQASKYKHTFKPNDDGGYYWYSTEKVE